MTVHRWRNQAKDVYYCYRFNKKQLKQAEDDIIYGRNPAPTRTPGRALVSDPTAAKAERLLGGRLEQLRQQVRAVERVMDRLATERRIDKLRLALLELVYFRRTHNLWQAAMQLEVGERTVKRWNDQLLEALARELGWLEDNSSRRHYNSIT